jgi:hypothetical protein
LVQVVSHMNGVAFAAQVVDAEHAGDVPPVFDFDVVAIAPLHAGQHQAAIARGVERVSRLPPEDDHALSVVKAASDTRSRRPSESCPGSRLTH